MMGGAGGGANMGQTGIISGSPNPPMMMPQMSASCPNNVQDDHTGMHGQSPTTVDSLIIQVQ